MCRVWRNCLQSRYRYPVVAHADTGDPDCCGCIFPVFRENEADITCNECGAVVKTVPADRAADVLMELAMAQESCTATCRHCGQENIFTGFSEMIAFICQHCGRGSSAQAITRDDFTDLDDEPQTIRPLPLPPRCRGIPIGDGKYTGCAYGYGEWQPFTGACDCPVCNGSGIEDSFQPN